MKRLFSRVFWGTYARCYDTVAQLVPYQKMLEEVVAHIPAEKDLRILDAGCGTGNLPQVLATRLESFTYYGIDFSRAMLERAKRKNPTHQFSLQDLSAPLPVENRKFDVVVCINVLYAVPDPRFTTAELYRVLKEEGVLIISTPRTKPQLLPILREHLKSTGMVGTLRMAPALLLVGLFNLAIVKFGQRGSLHFLKRSEAEELLGSSSSFTAVKTTYSQQNWLLSTKGHHP